MVIISLTPEVPLISVPVIALAKGKVPSFLPPSVYPVLHAKKSHERRSSNLAQQCQVLDSRLTQVNLDTPSITILNSSLNPRLEFPIHTNA